MKVTQKAADAFFYQSYASKPKIDGVKIEDLRRSVDDGGFFIELTRLPDPIMDVKQINYSAIEPGIIKAYHLHPEQTDVWFVPPTDRLLMVLVDVRLGSPSEGTVMRFMLGAGNSRLVHIPPGVAHGCKNLSNEAGRIIYFVDRYFDPDQGEEGRLPWDYLGEEIWEEIKG